MPPPQSVSAVPRAASALLLGLAGWTLWRLTPALDPRHNDAQPESVINRDHFGQTTLTNHVAVLNSALAGRSDFIGARVDRTYGEIGIVRRTILGLPSDATIAIRYSVTYPIGFDIRPGRVTVAHNGNGLLITLDKARLLSAPGIRFLGHDVLNGGLFINEDVQVIAAQRRQYDAAVRRGAAIAADPAVAALCEQRLRAFLQGFLANQPGADPPPTIRFAYR
jgi:hypothetical protein